MDNRYIITWITLLILNLIALQKCDEISITKHDEEITDLAKEIDSRLLIFSTLNGDLFGIDQETGKIKWKIKDKAIIKVPKDSPDAIIPLFLPDPRDGSLYLIGSGKDHLKKLPFTIPELVTSSPCRSSDGILYTGKKKDTWFLLDPNTGKRQHILGWDFSQGATCPVRSPDAIFVGRTEYSIMMVDSKHANRKWNVTFHEYSAASISKDTLANYELAHFASSSSGLLITLDRRRASILWDKDLGSPVIAAYILDPEGLITLPFTSLSNQTLHNFAMNILNNEHSLNSQPNQIKLYPTLYIGEHSEGLYALPSFVDQNMVTITNSEGKPLMLEGPDGSSLPQFYVEYPFPGQDYLLPHDTVTDTLTFQSMPTARKYTIIYLGHYELPNYSKTKLQISGNSHIVTKLITDESGAVYVHSREDKEIQADKIIREPHKRIIYLFEFVMIFVPGVVGFYFLYVQKWNLLSFLLKFTRKDVNVMTKVPEELPEGLVRIGKITFNPNQLLGKGCEGTFVYRGEFEGRRVAVKRLLPECFNFADREVALLRESDAHPNVIRYFCTEQDRMFRYIALELGQATLCDYVNGICPKNISPIEILQQATAGLAHLHSLDIVHRDIKPQNVLLSMAGPDGKVRAMISDFGLSKKLQLGRVSFSRRSGVTGTDGWIAPEMLNECESTTCAIDMFSLGCLYYYVLSHGKHPFGDTLRRQANISSGEWTLDELNDCSHKVELYKPIIMSLISSNPVDRPSCKAVLIYPMFWSCRTILAFLQDVSDRVEKSDMSDPVLQTLEKNGNVVVRGDWRIHIHEEVSSDLRKYRSYRGDSLRDLLRALRNKKHHYHELSQEAREILGEIPDNFTEYWTSRFPLLLIHTWLSMQILSSEETFKQYYSYKKYTYATDLINYNINKNELENFKLIQLRMLSENDNLKPQKRNPKNYKYKKNFTNVGDADKPKCLGLYRNLNGDSQVQSKYKDVDVADVKISFESKKLKTKRKENDVPLMWILPQDKPK